MRRSDPAAVLRAVERIRAGETLSAALDAERLPHRSTLSRACARQGVAVRPRGRPAIAAETLAAAVQRVVGGERVADVAQSLGIGEGTLHHHLARPARRRAV